MSNSKPTFSIVILTYNRENYLRDQLPDLNGLMDTEVIVVDNHSDDNYADRLAENYERTKVIRLKKNFGAVGRNYGIKAANGKYVVTLDDDVWGITNAHLEEILRLFEGDDSLAGVCFKVLDAKTGEITNWCHPRDPEKYALTSFDTFQISEGAVAFRRNIFESVGYYPEDFFISHEGPDLGLRILNANKRIIYTPTVEVNHAHAVEGRKNWRRYYYDTRNLIWLAYRNYNCRMLVLIFPIKLTAMFFYSIRDGFARYFFKALFDSFKKTGSIKGTRYPLNEKAYKKFKKINSHKPSLSFYIKNRVLKKKIKI